MTALRRLPNGAFRSIEAALPDLAGSASALRSLGRHLDTLADGGSLGQRTDGLGDLAAWLRERDRHVPLPAGRTLGPGESNPALRRLACFVRLIEASPPLRDAVRAAIRELLDHVESVGTLADTGVEPGRGFVGEFARRAADRLLPAPREADELATLLARVFPSEAELDRLRHLPRAWFDRVGSALFDDDARAQLRRSTGDAIALLAVRVEAAALAPPAWNLASTRVPRASAFFGCADALRDSVAEGARARLGACRQELQARWDALEQAGVTVGRIHALDALGKSLDRLDALIAARHAPAEHGTAPTQRLLVQMVDARLEATGLRRWASDALRHLARRIVEGHSRTGEHYIARTRAEYDGMWRAALGGGLLTLATAAIKLRIALLGLAPMPEGLLAGLNYAASFLVMLALHFALATKQPAMTAASLAAIVRTTGGSQRLDRLADQVAATVRTQLAAAAGNVLAVGVAALAFDALLRALTGHSWIPDTKAAHVLHSFHPLRSGTIPYAALTGVILWASGLIGGWFENWMIAHRLPEAIAQHPLGDRVGAARLATWAEQLRRNASPWAGSIALGFLLGLTPSVGVILGLPLDVRHVTLSSGMLAFAASARLGDPHLAGELAWAIAGIAVIFVLNLSVSFLLALVLALRAQEVPMFEALRLGRKLLGRFLRNPWQFVAPPADDDREDARGA